MKRKTVLIVEDELDMRIFISTLFETSGYQPIITKDGTEGMLKATDSNVCLTLHGRKVADSVADFLWGG